MMKKIPLAAKSAYVICSGSHAAKTELPSDLPERWYDAALDLTGLNKCQDLLLPCGQTFHRGFPRETSEPAQSVNPRVARTPKRIMNLETKANNAQAQMMVNDIRESAA